MATSTAQMRSMQGVAIPADSVNPRRFFELTRRHTLLEQSITYDGQDQIVVPLRKADIISAISVRFVGTLTTNDGTGTVKSSRRWPYDLLRRVKFSANGQSQLIDCSGAKLKVRDLMKSADLTDRSVVQSVAGASLSNGTMALAGEAWGTGSGTTAVVDGAKDVDLLWHIPIAEDERDLYGAIFLQTTSSDLTLTLDLTPLAQLIPITGDATATLTGKFEVITHKFSIPAENGGIVVPDLSAFHAIIENRYSALNSGPNEPIVIGQGAGKSLLRIYWQLWNGAGTAAVPVPLTSAGYGEVGWRYGSAETPELYPNGSVLRQDQERRYNSDFAGVWGFGCHDFVSENSFRDVVDMGTASELRLVLNLQAGLALTSPALEVVTETVFLAGQAA